MTTEKLISIEAYALKHERLHPQAVECLQPHFPLVDVENVPIQIHTVCWWRSTPCVVSRGVIHFAKGVLNGTTRWEKGGYGGVYFNLAIPTGMARLGHEIIHVQQWRENPGKLVRENINAVGRVIAKGDTTEWWASPFEQEAIAKERSLRAYFDNHPQELLPFRNLRCLMTGKEFADILATIDTEGFNYAFMHYSDFAHVSDDEFHRLRRAYVTAANDLQHYLGLEETDR